MEQTWIVVANAGRARVFAQDNNGALDEIETMINAAVRLRTAETENDRIGPTAPGKSIHNVGAATPNKQYEPAHTPAEHETELFARSVTGFLLEGQQQQRFQHLALIASPEFLGTLRGLLDPQLRQRLAWEINRDYTQSSAAQLREQIAAHQQKAH